MVQVGELTALPASQSGAAKSRGRVWRAADDLVDGLRRSWLWTTLAQQDIKLRYRGSVLGPFWQTLTTAVMIAGLGAIYSQLFNTTLDSYLPMLAAGLIFWNYVAGMLTEGCTAFTSVQHFIQQVKMPFSLYAYRVVYRNMLTLGHNFLIMPVVLLIFPPATDWQNLLLVVAAFLLVTLNGVWITMLFGMISARYRDVPPIVVSIVQVLFFVTPIFWHYRQLGDNAWWVLLNPLFALIDVMRAPLLGSATAPYSWDIVLGMTVLGWGLTFTFFARFRHRLAFWV
jgi:ABC-type polysaccharide/polyol phosphate export permease